MVSSKLLFNFTCYQRHQNLEDKEIAGDNLTSTLQELYTTKVNTDRKDQFYEQILTVLKKAVEVASDNEFFLNEQQLDLVAAIDAEELHFEHDEAFKPNKRKKVVQYIFSIEDIKQVIVKLKYEVESFERYDLTTSF